MMPEQRFTRIENLLSIMTEHEARFDEMLEAQRVRHDKEISEIRELQNAFATGMIRLQESQQTTDKKVQALTETVRVNAEANAEAQRVTEEKLNALIDIVDRIIRGRRS